jgi:thiol-disulfide isomerase/thioredoxin
MKKTLFFLVVLAMTIDIFAQNIILNPKTGMSVGNNSIINKVVLTDSTTSLFFTTNYTPGWWISIPKETYIQPNGGEKIYIKRTEGIPLNERYTMPASGQVSYVLIFPAVSKATTTIDYGEGNEGGSWFIYDIQIKPAKTTQLLPAELRGNWFDKTTGNWELGVFEKYIVYKNKLWTYTMPKSEKMLNSILITNNGLSKKLFYKVADKGNLMIGETAQTLKQYSNEEKARKVKSIDDKPYELPVFKVDSATYSGYIRNYTTKSGAKTMAVHVDDIIVGNQSTYLVNIEPSGYFTVRLPLYYPHLVWVRSSIFNGSVFLEPGKEVFQLLDGSKSKLYMGDLAKINSDIERLEKINSSDYYQIQNNILNMSPAQYKPFIDKMESKDILALDSVWKTKAISDKAYQIMKMNLQYNYAGYKMFYEIDWESAYRAKNNIPREQRTLNVKPDSLTIDYLDFITNEFVNNPIAVIAPNYNTFINRLKYLDIISDRNSMTLNTSVSSIAEELVKTGYELTESEKEMVEKSKEIDLVNNSQEQKQYNEKYQASINAFYQKYQNNIQQLYKENPKASVSHFEEYFKKNNIELTDNENELLKVMVEYSKSDAAIKIKQFYEQYGDSISAFYRNNDSFVNNIFNSKRSDIRNEKLKALFNIEQGIATDLMTAQDYCRKIVEEISPVRFFELQAIRQKIKTPFIAEYIELCNQWTKMKLEANKKKTGYIVNETPKTEADKIFEAIVAKYKGKIIYVDFWATWCSPCRSGIEQIKPLKEELVGKDIVFVYITNPTSPQTTWNNMIPDIKGEHYRVAQDEWNHLTAKFNISGIPHYVLVGKNGEVINPNLGHYGNNELKSILEKHMNQ